ncbi:ABC transporter ATP-binding protein [Dysgonomonas massiliensis]|uniref:ABC transporter ATP-binding protein n=1 Tax=Dysgonomonas massiliensis TaxID=2040292 RepID=UPI000C76A9B4|nr:ABC transporter ATP-binding protein [Dysgonomonas massiliensis]
MKRKSVISAENISIGYPRTKSNTENSLYDNLSFELFPGELVCLLGSNGAGKSTLLRSISNSQPVVYGDIFLDGKIVKSYTEKDLSKIIGLVLTDKTSVGGLTVRELVELGRYPYTGFWGKLSKDDQKIIDQVINDVGIIHKANSYIAELSDGERQKAMIAKVLAQECPIILLDEPTAFLDIKSNIEIMNLLRVLAHEKEKTILMSTHNIDLALLLADRLWLLSPHIGLESGVTEDIVLSGKLDGFFKSENIQFNKDTGNFIPRFKGRIKASINTNSDLYYHWTKNFLERNDVSVMDSEEEVSFDVEIVSPSSIHVKTNNDYHHFSDYSQFSSWLRKKSN